MPRRAAFTRRTQLATENPSRPTAKFCLGLVARRPSAAGVTAHRTAHRAKRLVQRDAKRLGLDVPYRDIDAGNGLHDHAPAPAFISLRDTALECRFAA
jgi:hypothetical protein